MLILRPPGVYPPQGDTVLLADALREAGVPPGARVLDVCTGTGVVALAAALGGARSVTATDISARAVLAARLNARLRGHSVRVLRGDLVGPVAGEEFDVITANPPYVPC
ncbi:MAG TPA: methyltransferase, partial [Thermomonospora sp.]|nr:methyltransferase [Thermomonospora sp.]